MKMLRQIVLVGLTAILVTSCAGLPPVFQSFAPKDDVQSGELVEENAATQVEPATAPAVVAPAEAAPAAAAPTAAPVQAAGRSVSLQGLEPLSGVIWEWVAFLKAKPVSQSVVPDPARYTATFDDEGHVSIQADCVSVTATYGIENGALSVKLDSVKAEACAPGSISAAFLAQLSHVGSFEIDGDDLILRLAGSGDTMIFRNGGPVVDAATKAPLATEAPVAAAAPSDTSELAGAKWQWERFVDVAGLNNIEVNDPDKYTVVFGPDGTVAMTADCNQASGKYAVDGSSVTLTVGPMTLAMCAEDSLSEPFLVNLTSAASFSFEEGKLLVELMADGGTMVFGAAD